MSRYSSNGPASPTALRLAKSLKLNKERQSAQASPNIKDTLIKHGFELIKSKEGKQTSSTKLYLS